MMNLTPPGGMTGIGAILLGGIIVATLVVTIVAIRRALKAQEAIWYLIILLLPPLGSIIAIVALDSEGRRRPAK